MKLIASTTCTRCEEVEKTCVEVVVLEFKNNPEFYPDYTSSKICSDCISSMLQLEDTF